MSDNIYVTPSTDSSKVPVATRTLTVNTVTGIEVPYGILGYESTGVLVPIDTTHGLPVDPIDRSGRLLGHVTVDAAPAIVLGAGSAVVGAVTQSGTWTVIANAGSGTFAVSAASLPLPTGAATAAKQPALGTAGTAATDVLTVQGIASMTPLNVAIVSGGGSGGTASNFGSAFPTPGTAIGVKDSTGANLVPLNADASGYLKVNVAAGGASGGTSSTVGSAVPSTGTAAGFSDGTDLQLARVFDVDSGAGTQYVVGLNLRGSSSGGSVEIATASNPLRTDPTGTTTQPVSGTVTANAGSGPFPVGGTVASGATDSGNPVKVGGVHHTSAPTLSDGQRGDLQVDANGNLLVAITAGSSLALGQAVMADSLPVVIASDQSAVPVSAASLPLPSGAATAANQATGNTSLGSLDTKTPALGQALSAACTPVVLPAAQITTLTPPTTVTANLGTLNGAALDATLGTLVTTTDFDGKVGSLTETAPSTDTASSGLNGRLQRLAQRLSSLIALLPTALTGSGNLKAAIVENTAALPAGTNTIGVAITASQSGAIYSGTTSVTPTAAFLNATASGDTAVIAGTTGKKIRVVSYTVGPAAAAVNVLFKSSGGTVLSSTKNLAANGGMGRSYNPHGHFLDTVTGEGLTVNLSAAVNVGIDLQYILV